MRSDRATGIVSNGSLAPGPRYVHGVGVLTGWWRVRGGMALPAVGRTGKTVACLATSVGCTHAEHCASSLSGVVSGLDWAAEDATGWKARFFQALLL